jgi:hypothetical protein
MKVLLRLVLVGILVLGFNTKSFAQGGQSAVPFLLLAPDSKSGALGESGTGLADNSAAIFWNPAGLAFQTGTELSITHSNWLPQFHLDLFYDYLTYKQYYEEVGGTISGSITYMNYGEFIQTGENSPDEIGRFRSFDAAATVGYATKLSPDWGIGFNFRVIHSRLSGAITVGEQRGEGSATTVSFDIGGMWRPEHLVIPLVDEDIGNEFSIGANLSNLGPKIYYINKDQADPIPTNFRLGFAYKILDDEYNSLTYTLDFSKLLVGKAPTQVVKDASGNDTTIVVGQKDDFYKAIFTSWTDEPFKEEIKDIISSMGLEFTYGKASDFLFALRAGYFYEDPTKGNRKFLSFGAGLRYDMYGFDFSYLTTSVFPNAENHPLNDTMRFTLLIGWGATVQPKGLPRGI